MYKYLLIIIAALEIVTLLSRSGALAKRAGYCLDIDRLSNLWFLLCVLCLHLLLCRLGDFELLLVLVHISMLVNFQGLLPIIITFTDFVV